MAYQQKDGDIAVFTNKKTKDTQPDWTGTAVIDGTEYKVAFWEKSPTMLAGKIELKQQRPDAHNEAKQNGYQPQPDMEDEIPF